MKTLIFVFAVTFLFTLSSCHTKRDSNLSSDVKTYISEYTRTPPVENDDSFLFEQELSKVDFTAIKTFEQYYDIRHDLGEELYALREKERIEYNKAYRQVENECEARLFADQEIFKSKSPELFSKWQKSKFENNSFEKERIEKLPEFRKFFVSQREISDQEVEAILELEEKHLSYVKLLESEYTLKESMAFSAYEEAAAVK